MSGNVLSFFFFSFKSEVSVYLQFKLTEFFILLVRTPWILINNTKIQEVRTGWPTFDGLFLLVGCALNNMMEDTSYPSSLSLPLKPTSPSLPRFLHTLTDGGIQNLPPSVKVLHANLGEDPAMQDLP